MILDEFGSKVFVGSEMLFGLRLLSLLLLVLKERVGRNGWRLGDRLRGVGSGGTFRAGGPTGIVGSEERGDGSEERERKLRERVSYGRGKERSG